MATEIETIERLLHHYEAKMQEYVATQGEIDPCTVLEGGVEIGHRAEVRALSAALSSLRKHGIPQPEGQIETYLWG